MATRLQAPSPPPLSKFGVYENPVITSALSRQTIRRKPWHCPVVLTLCCAALSAAWALQSRAEELRMWLRLAGVGQSIAGLLLQFLQGTAAIFVLMTASALYKIINLQAHPNSALTSSSRAKLKTLRASSSPGSPAGLLRFDRERASSAPPSETPRRRGEGGPAEPLTSSTSLGVYRHRPPLARQSPSQPVSPLLVPVHPQKSSSKPSINQWTGRGDLLPAPASSSPAPTKPPSTSSPAPSGSPFHTPPSSSDTTPAQAGTPATQGSSGGSTRPRLLSWSKDRMRAERLEFGEIDSEQKLSEFLADVDGKLAEGNIGRLSGGTSVTPSPTVQGGRSGASPSSATAMPGSSAPRSAVRALRMSPGAPASPTKKGELEMPLPMSMEQADEVFRRLGVYSQMEQWRDGIRQWFSDVLLNPLVRKIDSSHIQAMNAATKLNVTIVVAQVGVSKQEGLTPISFEGSQQEWLTTIAPDEDAFLHQLRAALLHARDAPNPPQSTMFSSPQEKVYNPHLQTCLDAITEHQRLKALMRGEWVKGLLIESSVRTEFTVQRIRDLAEGTCVKAYEYWPNGEVYDKIMKRWTPDLPSDAHLLLYLFCALLDHPQWMLHLDPTSYPSTQSGNNFLFIAALPHKERYPEKYIAVISGAPPVLHAGATVLAVGKTSPPVFALYWDRKLQYSFQGRSALWDAILLLCYRVKVAHGGVVRGIDLGSPAFNLLSVLSPSFDSHVN